MSMLILTRRPAERIMIGDSIAVSVLEVRGGQVRLGVDAPKEVAVHRSEIYDRIQQEGKSKRAKPHEGADGAADQEAEEEPQ